uniref:Uncharacterized protein n=1 Tax=Trichogramma kaykai TaxID=54128 RepID=A0ABD2WVQ6_9HYME
MESSEDTIRVKKEPDDTCSYAGVDSVFHPVDTCKGKIFKTSGFDKSSIFHCNIWAMSSKSITLKFLISESARWHSELKLKLYNKRDEKNLITKLLLCQNVSTTIVEMNFLSADFIDSSDTINIILVEEEIRTEYVKTYIDKYSQMFPNNNRPKTLIILFGVKSKSASNIKSISKYGWSKQFLDISFMEEDDACIVKMYNPFSKELMKKAINDKQDAIFPDKLINGYKYKLIIGINAGDKLSDPIRNESGHAIDIRKPLFSETELVLESINFSSSFAETNVTDYSTGLTFLLEQLRNNEINLISVPYGYKKFFENITHVFIDSECMNISALMPEQFKGRLQFPKRILQTLLTVPATLGFIIWILRLTKIVSDKVTILKILGTLLGITVDLKPSKNSELTVLMSIFFISTIYPTDFYSNLIEEKVIQNIEMFDTYKSIVESELEIFISSMYSNLLEDSDDADAIDLKKKRNFQDDASTTHKLDITIKNMEFIDESSSNKSKAEPIARFIQHKEDEDFYHQEYVFIINLRIQGLGKCILRYKYSGTYIFKWKKEWIAFISTSGKQRENKNKNKICVHRSFEIVKRITALIWHIYQALLHGRGSRHSKVHLPDGQLCVTYGRNSLDDTSFRSCLRNNIINYIFLINWTSTIYSVVALWS